jgi:DNA-binding CsgD family transcriptional regulator
LAEGNPDQAAAHFAESLRMLWDLGARQHLPQCLQGLADVACARSQPARAARLLGMAEALREAIGTPLPPAERERYDRGVAAVRASLGEEAFAAALATGRALPLAEAVAEACAVADGSVEVEVIGDGDVPGDAAVPAALTPRELEILRLMADGRLDREIAAVLAIRPRIVGNHIARVLVKLGVVTRAAAVALAVRRGLI